MKILAVGGGSGGHVTPVVAVLRVLKHQEPNSDIRFWCDRGFYKHAVATVHHFDETIVVDKIFAGKLRRYNNIPLWKQLLRPDIVLPNIRDGFFITLGFFQSLIKLIIWRPDVVFAKGGFVCLPVGLATHILRIPLVIHDSDAHPGLTNRVLSRWATSIATGAPLKYYRYPKSKSRYVGIPVSSDCHPYSETEKAEHKQLLGFDVDRPLAVVIGGGLGAKRLNDAVVRELKSLLEFTNVMIISGSAQYK